MAFVPSCGRSRGVQPALWVAALIFGVGCGSIKQTGTARTGTEQLLLTSAWDRALEQVDFRDLTGVPVFLDATNIAAVDQGWVVSSLRQALLAQGVLLRPKVEQAQYVVEARVGAYGTDDYNWMVGVPQFSIPPTLTGIPTGTVPEMPFIKKSDQHAVAKLALFAYDKTTGQIVWKSGTKIDSSNVKNMYIGGFGPIKSGTFLDGTEVAGYKVVGADEGDPASQPQAKARWWRRKRKASPPPDPPGPGVASPAPMAAKSDLDSFRP